MGISEAPREIRSPRNPDSSSGYDRRGNPLADSGSRLHQEIISMTIAIDFQRLRKFSRPGTKLMKRHFAAPFDHPIQSIDRLQGAK